MDHLRRPNADLGAFIEAGEVLIHPFVLGEIALGQLKRRAEIIADLAELEFVPKAEDGEVIGLIERFKLQGSGLGWVDCHLIAAARLAHAQLLTNDLALKAAWIKVH